MDLSALIFVALAVAWAAYLLPKALKHHDDRMQTETLERMSDRLRVLARRDVADDEVNSDERVTASTESVETVVIPWAQMSPAQRATRRRVARQAAKRRMRVFLLLVTANAVVGGLIGFAYIPSLYYVAIPAGLLVAWLVACRLMVRSEQRDLVVRQPAARTGVPTEASSEQSEIVDDVPTSELLAVSSDVASAPEPAPTSGWEPVPSTLPTYIAKQAAPRRAVQQIDLDSTGVWTSGNTESDSALAREAEEADRVERAAEAAGDDAERRATGS